MKKSEPISVSLACIDAIVHKAGAVTRCLISNEEPCKLKVIRYRDSTAQQVV